MQRLCAIVALCGGFGIFESLGLAGAPAGFQPMFDGRTLAGWEGNSTVWKVEGDRIVGQSPGLKNNEFLATTARYQDFMLRLQFRLTGGKGNSGVQFRSERIPNHHEMIGYQADVGEQYWGCLYDESRRNKVLVRPPDRLEKVLKKADWNEYQIRCMGKRIEMYLNGLKVVDYTEEQADIPRNGRIALQVHSSNEPIRVEFKEIYLQEFPVPIEEAADRTGFVLKRHRGEEGECRYVLFLPAGYHQQPDKRWPVILFLHGAGERGTDGELGIKVGIGPAVLRRAASFGFIVVAPQAEKTWDADSPDGRRALAILDDVLQTYRADRQQVHLTGLSMGGMGTWSLAAKHPQRWATIAPVCGPCSPGALDAVAKLPIWGFCGDKDFPKFVEGMRAAAKALKEKGANSRYTEYPGVGHNCWDLAYNTDELYQWMLRRGK